MARRIFKIAGQSTLATIGGPLVAAGTDLPTAQHTLAEQTYQQWLDQLVADGAPGALALVHKHGSLWAGVAGYSSVENATAMAVEDRFVVGSISKTFVAALVLKLYEEGTLTLEDSLDQWLPGILSDGSEISIRHLLGHTSGLADYAQSEEFMEPYANGEPLHIWTPRQMVAMSAASTRLGRPGEGFSYSNTNYVLLGLVVESATGELLGKALDQHLFEPLELENTALAERQLQTERLAQGYIGPNSPYFPNGSEITPAAELSHSLTRGWGDGAIVSTLYDLADFFRALVGDRLLRRETFEEMTEGTSIGNKAGYGLGLTRLNLGNINAYGHAGDSPGYTSEAFISEDAQTCVVVAVNGDANSLGFRRSDLERFVDHALQS